MSSTSKKQYELNSDTRERLTAMLLLWDMINEQDPPSYPVTFAADDEDRHLLPVLKKMARTRPGYLEVKAVAGGDHYVPTEAGRKVLKQFLERYYLALRVFDHYHAVDPESSEFAMSKRLEMDDDEYERYQAQERFVDYRVPVLEYKNDLQSDSKKQIDVLEIVFMTFAERGYFMEDYGGKSWQYNLVSGESSVWQEILEICNNPDNDWREMGFEDPESGEWIEPKTVVENIVAAGNDVMVKLIAEAEADESDEDDDEGGGGGDDIVEEVIVEQYYPGSYYTPWWDPFYIAPLFWYDPYYYYW